LITTTQSLPRFRLLESKELRRIFDKNSGGGFR
jgi:hypothetical protein